MSNVKVINFSFWRNLSTIFIIQISVKKQGHKFGFLGEKLSNMLMGQFHIKTRGYGYLWTDAIFEWVDFW